MGQKSVTKKLMKHLKKLTDGTHKVGGIKVPRQRARPSVRTRTKAAHASSLGDVKAQREPNAARAAAQARMKRRTVNNAEAAAAAAMRENAARKARSATKAKQRAPAPPKWHEYCEVRTIMHTLKGQCRAFKRFCQLYKNFGM